MMVSSVAKKELTHEWENERYKDYQESMRNFQSSSKSETHIPKSAKKTSKQEIFLPKTRLSRTGQLLLFTNDDETDLYQTKINSILAKKSYSKKWIEDVGQELNMEAAKFLDERLNENLDTFLTNRKSLGKIIGKNSNFLIQDLNTKSGKDRRLQKTPYLEYLPTNFDPKSELANALKSLNSLENFDRMSTSHSNRISGLSFAEIVDSNSSDDEKNEKLEPTFSRLSSQPILSTKALINKLSSSAKIGNNLSTKENIGENNDKPEELVQNIPENEIAISYKDTFEPELSTSAKPSSRRAKSSARDEKNDKSSKKSTEFQKNILNSKKILEKRYVIRTQNSSPIANTKTTENSETISISNTKSSKPNSQLNTSIVSKATTYTAARKKIISPKLADIDNNRTNLNSLAISGANKYDADDFQNLNSKNQSSFYSSFVNNRAPNTPLPSHDKTFTSGSAIKPCVHFKPIPDNEDLEPITISVTEIENELTGNSIKIRRFFDRQSIRINKMEIKQEPKQTFSNKTSKSFSAQSTKKREIKQQLFEENKMEPEIDNFSIKLVPKVNRIKSAPIKNSSQSKFLLIPNLELETESNQSDFRQKNDQFSEIFVNNETLEKKENFEAQKNFENSPESELKQDLETDKVKMTENVQVESSPKKENSVSDKNYLSADYVDNLSISSRVSSVRKNSTDWVYYENNSEKNETESEAYEKLNKSSKISSEKKIEETSSSDYQQIMSSRRQSDQEISYKEYYETKYDDTDISGKIDTIIEENSECVAQILANNLENYLSENQNEETRTSAKSIDHEENAEIKEQFIDSDKTELEVEQEIVLAISEKEIIAGQDEKAVEINKIDDEKEENIMSQVDSKNEVNLKDEENFKDQEDEFNSKKLDDVHQLSFKEEIDYQKKEAFETNIENKEIDNTEHLEQYSPMLENQSKENLTERIVVEQIEHQDEKKMEFIDFNPIKDLIESENVKSGTIEISDKIEDFEDNSKRKISISIVIKQAELAEESNSTFGTNFLMNKTEADKVSPDNEKNYLDKINVSQVLAKSDQINQIENDNVISSSRVFDDKAKSSQIGDKNVQISSEKEKNKKELFEFDNKSTTSEKQTKKVEFSDHVIEKIIAPSNNSLSENSNIEKSSLNECKKPADLGAKLKNKNNLESENINKKPKTQALSKSIKNEEPKNEIKTKEETTDKPSKYKINLSSIDDLLGIKNEDTIKDQDTKNDPKKLQKPVKESKFERKMREKRERYKNFPYLQLPWDSYKAIVDQESYKEAFSIPDVLNPLIHQINPENTSVDELVLERRILEDKILELRQEKLTILTMTDEERAKMAKKNDKKKTNKKVVDLKVKQDMEFKERIIREERIRLQHESYKKKLERDNVRKLLDEALLEKEKEIENLENELSANQKELNSQLNGVMEQISYLEGTEDQIREVLAQARAELRNRIKQNQQDTRRNLREMHEERKESKLFDFNVKKKELEWLLGMYTDSSEELDKIKAKQESLESDIEQWMFKFENECIDQEKELEDREVEEDNMLITMEHEEEENALKSIKQEQFELLQEKKSLIENFEEIKTKIIQRIEIVKQEREVMMGEKKQFELNILMDVERQNQKLLEIIDAEKQAKEEIKKELEQYKQTLLLRREKNLNLKTDLSFLTHSHNITKPFVFSYVMHWPIELFAKPFDQDKIKKSKPKK